MTDDPLDGPRIAEVLLGELVGRSLGALAPLDVEDLDRPDGFACAVDESYTVTADGVPAATLVVHDAHVEVSLVEATRRLRIERGGSIKPALDELVRQTTN